MITATHKGKYYDVEYSIINVLELEESLRIGAETYHPEKIKTLKFLNNKAKDITIGTYFHLIRESFDPKKSSSQKIKLLELENMGNFEIFDIPEVSSTEFYSTKNIAQFGDIVISKLRPYLRQVGFIYLPKVYTTTELLILRPKNKNIEDINYYLYTFLITRWVQKILFWSQEGVNHPRFPKHTLLNCPMPKPSSEFIFIIKRIIKSYFKLKQKAEQLYKQAEEILLEELGLKNWKPKTKKIKIGGREFEEEENISIRMLSEIIKADRMDAEYWEAKYDEIEELIKNYKNGYSIVSKEFLHKTDRRKINKNDYYNYVEISSVNTSIGDFTPSYLKGKDLPANAKLTLEEMDLIVSKVRTYRKGIALVYKTYPNLIGSSAFVVLHEKENPKINIETLFVFLRTDIFSLWSYKFYTGTSYPTLTDEDILNLPIPKVKQQNQQKISNLIQQSFKAKENSKKLLEIAKKTVEIYIEKDEEEGLNYARKKLNELNIEIN